MKYFVMAINPLINFRNYPMPISDDDDIMELFDTEEEAEEMTIDRPLCQEGRYEIYEWPYL